VSTWNPARYPGASLLLAALVSADAVAAYARELGSERVVSLAGLWRVEAPDVWGVAALIDPPAPAYSRSPNSGPAVSPGRGRLQRPATVECRDPSGN